jgi:membrane-associated phospholipid phosphatase
VAVVALMGFVLLTWSLGRLEWTDAYVATFADALRGCDGYPVTLWLTRMAPYLGIALLVSGTVISRRRGASLEEILPVFASLVVALLLLEGFKLLVIRERPGGVGHLGASSSFPSGHVAHAAFCAAAAVALIGRRANRWDVVRGSVASVGSVFVLAVAVTRVYVGLHWTSDVAASLLLGLSFGAMLSGRPPAKRAMLRPLVLVAIPCLYLTAACGVRLTLPSPATPIFSASRGGFTPHATFGLHYGVTPDIDLPEWSIEKPNRDAARSDLRLHLEPGEGEGGMLKVIGNSSLSLTGRGCGFMQLFVDEAPRGELRLEGGWWAYAFPLPTFSEGPHELRLHLAPDVPLPVSMDPLLTLRTLQLAYPTGRPRS